MVIPAYNERNCLALLHERLTRVLREGDLTYELLFVDDGSTDGTPDGVRRIAAADPRVRWIFFSRNFGHEAASTAGLENARGQVVVLMDADLQDPPELIPQMLARWREGYDVVTARRKRRAGESGFKRATAWSFYRLLNALTRVEVPPDTGDFRLMDRSVVDEFKRLPEQNRFVRGLIAWIGHRQTAIEFDRPQRQAGQTKYGVWKLCKLALDALVSFSIVPLRFASALGAFLVVVSLLAAGAALVESVGTGVSLGGPVFLATGLFFLGGVQMVLLGILGEYVGRIHAQVQQRPLYVVRDQGGRGIERRRARRTRATSTTAEPRSAAPG